MWVERVDAGLVHVVAGVSGVQLVILLELWVVPKLLHVFQE